jgi:hypothetical protein
VARRWRALSRTKLRELEKDQEWRLQILIEGVFPLLNAFKRAKGDETLEDKFRVILDLADKIERAIFEGIMSQDYQLIHIDPSCSFDEDIMTNANESSRRKRKKARLNLDQQAKEAPKPVLCTVSLGLRQDDVEFNNGRLIQKPSIIILPAQVSLTDVLG